jgi:hypothetical protein
MMRKSVLDSIGGYDERYRVAEDRALWLKLAEEYSLANLPYVLCEIRVRPDSITRTQGKEIRSMVQRACSEALRRDKIKFSDRAVARFLWQQALFAAESKQYMSASYQMNEICENYPDALNDHCWRAREITRVLIARERNSNDQLFLSSREFLHVIFDLLPTELRFGKDITDWIVSELNAARAFDAFYMAKFDRAQIYCLRAWLGHPSFRRNLGLYSIFVRSFVQILRSKVLF